VVSSLRKLKPAGGENLPALPCYALKAIPLLSHAEADDDGVSRQDRDQSSPEDVVLFHP
jgi:hypothetical protein